MNDIQKEEVEVLQSIFVGTDAFSVSGTRVDVCHVAVRADIEGFRDS